MAQGGEIAFVPLPCAQTQGHQYRSHASMTAILVLSMALEQRQPGRLRLRLNATHGHPAVDHIGRAWRWLRVSVHLRTRLYREFRNNVSTQLLNDFLSRALSVFEVQDNVVHPDLLKRLQQKTQMVASQFEP